ncbi:hypothetical protein [Tychonema sp. LEGE 07203]|uniref:hypothetical protein n=1 Tax=Tychonema sp. LEGE 07203 TaxID=1828671 RepID=UPI0018812063|nr:hypothetical protein [Tychonema sp. LEGE 07203]MBE9097128.1 hypothetical protein [Tychonema sp. LEGE 07203]
MVLVCDDRLIIANPGLGDSLSTSRLSADESLTFWRFQPPDGKGGMLLFASFKVIGEGSPYRLLILVQYL